MENENQKFNLSELKPIEIAEHPRVKSSFVSTLTKIHKMSEAEANSAYERELIYYKKALAASDKLSKSTNISLYSAFLEIAITGLSIQPGGKSEAYLECRGSNAGTNNKAEKIYTASLCIMTYGELTMRLRTGQIVRMNNPIVIYEGDVFQPHTNDKGEMTVDYRPAIPRKSNTIVGCYVSMVLPHGGIDFKWLLKDDIERLKKYSTPKYGNDPQPNGLYLSNSGQIDTGFLEAKTIKHAMRTCTKLRVSDIVSFEGDDEIAAVDAIHANETFESATPTATQEQKTVTVNDEQEIF